jgi:hypothetical protein
MPQEPLRRQRIHPSRQPRAKRTMKPASCEIQSGEDGWPRAAPLLGQVWPPHVVAELAWNEVHRAHADRRVLLWAADGRLACHICAKWHLARRPD